MTEEEKRAYIDRLEKARTPYVGTWAPKFTPEQQAEQEKYIKDNNLPF